MSLNASIEGHDWVNEVHNVQEGEIIPHEGDDLPARLGALNTSVSSPGVTARLQVNCWWSERLPADSTLRYRLGTLPLTQKRSGRSGTPGNPLHHERGMGG